MLPLSNIRLKSTGVVHMANLSALSLLSQSELYHNNDFRRILLIINALTFLRLLFSKEFFFYFGIQYDALHP